MSIRAQREVFRGERFVTMSTACEQVVKTCFRLNLRVFMRVFYMYINYFLPRFSSNLLSFTVKRTEGQICSKSGTSKTEDRTTGVYGKHNETTTTGTEKTS